MLCLEDEFAGFRAVSAALSCFGTMSEDTAAVKEDRYLPQEKLNPRLALGGF
jgi:hypothetical protein